MFIYIYIHAYMCHDGLLIYYTSIKIYIVPSVLVMINNPVNNNSFSYNTSYVPSIFPLYVLLIYIKSFKYQQKPVG